MPKPAITTKNEWSTKTTTTKLTLYEKRLWLHKIGVFSVFSSANDNDNNNNVEQKDCNNCLFHCISQVLKASNNTESLSSSATDSNNNNKDKLLLTCENIRKSIINHAINCNSNNENAIANKKKLLNYWKTKLQCEQLLKLIQQRPDSSTLSTLSSSSSSSSYLLTPSSKEEEETTIEKEYTLRMSNSNQCGTIFELNHACNLYEFHVDYLIQISKTHGLYKIYNGTGATGVDGGEWIENTKKPSARNYYLFYYKRYSTCTCGHWQLLSPVVLLQPPPFNFPKDHKIYGKCYLYELKTLYNNNNPSKKLKFNLKNFINIEELDNIASNYEKNADKIVSNKQQQQQQKYNENYVLGNNETEDININNNNEILSSKLPYTITNTNAYYKWNYYSWTRLRTPINKQYQRLLVQRNNKKYI